MDVAEEYEVRANEPVLGKSMSDSGVIMLEVRRRTVDHTVERIDDASSWFWKLL